MNENRKKIVKSENQKKIFGVCAGVADYFNVDVTIVRVAWVIAVLCLGFGVVLYIVCALVFPEGYTNC